MDGDLIVAGKAADADRLEELLVTFASLPHKKYLNFEWPLQSRADVERTEK